jgi:hypothetical protein
MRLYIQWKHTWDSDNTLVNENLWYYWYTTRAIAFPTKECNSYAITLSSPDTTAYGIWCNVNPSIDPGTYGGHTLVDGKTYYRFTRAVVKLENDTTGSAFGWQVLRGKWAISYTCWSIGY